MIIRQEETTPIGNHFHDTGTLKLFEKITDMADDFEVDTEKMCNWIDIEINNLKSLKTLVKKLESEAIKQQHMDEVARLVNKV